MQLFKKINNLKLRSRINIYLSIILFLILIFLILLYNYQINSIFIETHEDMEVDQSDLISMLKITEELTGGGFTKKDYDILKPIFDKKKYFETGYPFLVTKSGDYIIHPTKEGQNQFNLEYHQKRLSFKNNNGYFKYVFKGDDSGRIKWQYCKYFEPYDAYIAVSFFEKELFRELSKLRNLIILSVIIAVFIFFYGVYIMLKPIVESINNIVFNIGEMAKGKIIKKLTLKNNDEIGEITKSINILIERNNETALFADEIGEGNLDAEYTHLSEEDVLGNSLLKMKNNLQHAKTGEDKRSIEVERQSWASNGLAKFADILRKNNDNLENLATEIIINIVDYLKANQGGIFILNDNDEENIHFNLLSAYAFDRRKFLQKQVEIGEGLIGTCVVEKKTIYMTDIPQDYMKITSGLGGANPTSLLIVPLKIEENVLGVLEIASFNIFEKYKIEFIEKLAESIASTFSSVRVNIRTSELLERSQQQAEEMAAQEEEMRQNMEELQATQEESTRKGAEMVGLVEALNISSYVIEYDLDGNIQNVNDNYLLLLGLTRDEAIGTHHSGNIEFTEQQKAEYEKFWTELKSGKVQKEITKVNINNKQLVLAETYTPIRNGEGNVYKILKISNNITD